MQRLNVSSNGHFLVKEDGTPFFWLGDTTWSAATIPPSDVTYYMNDRTQKGFTIIHVDADAYGAPNYAGERPFFNNNTDTPNEAWWQHIDYIINEAEARGIYICLFTMWSNVWDGTKSFGGYLHFNGDTAKAYRFGKWIGTRYKNKTNIIWSVAGEYNEVSPYSLYNYVAQGLEEAHAGLQLMTIHPGSVKTSSGDWHNSLWLDFNMLQTTQDQVYTVAAADYALSPAKPVVSAEQSYEENLYGGVRVTPALVRRGAYWAVFAGSFGFTYGHISIQTMNNPLERTNIITPWKDALNALGGQQMKYLRQLMESFPFLSRIPDQTVVTSNIGTGYHHVQATRDSNGAYALVYIPDGAAVTVNMAKITGGNVNASWYNPQTGAYSSIGTYTNSGTRTFDAPGSTAEGNDWVLVLKRQFDVPPSTDPIAQWKFDETSGTTASDSSGNGNTGTLVNGPVWTAGKVNNALSFDGTDDYVDLGNPATLQITGAMTITAWIYLDDLSATAHRIVSKLAAAPNRGWELVLDDDPRNNLMFRITPDGNNLFDVKQATEYALAGQWAFVAGTYEPGVATKLYLNGTLINSNTASVPSSHFNSGNNVNIGRGPTGYSPFDGLIDDVRIYNYALNASEIQALYQPCGDGSCSGETCSSCPQDCGYCPAQYFQPEALVEAESGNLISPMQIGSNSSASGGQYIYTTTNNQGSVMFSFNITQAGKYRTEARVLTPGPNTAATNSFYIGLDIESAQGNDNYAYDTLETASFAWDNVSLRGSGLPEADEFDPMLWDLSAGLHIFTFYGRESNTWLDQIILKRIQCHKSDSDCSGCVSQPELMGFISRWYINNQDVTLKELIEAIGLWKRGC